MINIQTSIILSSFSDLLWNAVTIIDENFHVNGAEALAVLEDLRRASARFQHLRTPPAPHKPEGTRFKPLPIPTPEDIARVGLSPETLPEFVRSIEDARRKATPKSAGSLAILRQIRDQGATDQQLTEFRDCLAGYEASAIFCRLP